jgi:hypothetical protein
MSTFAVVNSDQILDSVNYLLSNLGQSGNAAGNVTIPTGTLVGNLTTGVVTPYNTGGNAYSYLYQYVNLRYANNATGSSGFSSLPANSQYFGVFNSVTSTASLNPTDYSWQEVAGGFGTTKTIYYSAVGGRQVLFAAASSPPSSNYVISVANVAIDLDVVTTAAGTPGERGPIPMGYVITTADPAPPTSSATLTGWFQSSRTANTPPIGTGLIPVAGDTAYFAYPTTGASETYTFNGSAWNSAVGQVVSGDTVVGNSLPGNAITASSISGDRISINTIEGNNIAGSTITGNKITSNTITATNIQTATITATQIAAGTITANNIAANTITATQIATGTITANQIAANTITANNISSSYIYAGNIVSFGATLDSNSSTGYWLNYSTGNARFGGNVNIGNTLTIGSNATVGTNLIVGANASIGGNLAVDGLITGGGLNANSVVTITVAPSSITSGVGTSRNSNISLGTQGSVPSTYGIVVCEQINVYADVSSSTGIYVFGGASLLCTWTGGLPMKFVYRLYRRASTDAPGFYTQMYVQRSPEYPSATARDNSSIAYYDTSISSGVTYTYFWSVVAEPFGSGKTYTFSSDYNSIFAQALKR